MNITKQSLPKKTFLGKTAEVKISELNDNPIFSQTYPAIGKHLQVTNQELITSVTIYKEWVPQEDKTVLMPAFQVSENIQAGDFEVYTIPEGEAYVGIHNGSYDNLNEAHNAMMKHLESEGIEKEGSHVVEEYTVPPGEGVEEKDLVTRIYYYI